MSRLFSSPGSSRETVLFGGSDPNRNSRPESMKADISMTSKEQSTFSTTSVCQRLSTYSLAFWFSPKGLEPIEDIKKKGLEDVVFDAIALQELGTQHQAHGDHGTTKKAFLVELAVLETGILRVLGKYGILDFVPLSSDDPTISQQPAEDLDSKKALYYQRLHSKYSQEYVKRQRACTVLGVEMSKLWTDWYDGCLREIGNRLRKLGYC
ncbi:hypothetical protein N7471_013038 [Penicillium samsonianum]|uniref:uncharacterized protein n=1 Tax=Penicillium samsonianum TaxID=1882272 RepID=UPI002547503E|nr:uncharacterized protein N7471_013038 [Penicillium samsonianum]KAJ6119087.1 hypothetical protein N7471_013038 [Penicillium samsonianum]